MKLALIDKVLKITYWVVSGYLAVVVLMVILNH